ncbi:MAG: hybrid sensor histidine kinase/response regulator [Rhodobacteraceae bacterium]|nr:MAG: hybrid sensor histidine kinase/response regulator [Paracoccaceae bacterium]
MKALSTLLQSLRVLDGVLGAIFIALVAGVVWVVPNMAPHLRPLVYSIPIAVGASAIMTYFVMRRRFNLSPRETAKTAVLYRRMVPQRWVQELFDDLPIALLRLSRDGRIKQTNQFSRKILGLREGDTPYLSDIVSGMTRPVTDWLDELSERAAIGDPKLVQVTGPKSEMFLHVSMLSLDRKGGSDLVAVISDATELKTLEAQFVQSQKMQAIGQLAGGVAHDFNNVLTAISGYCDLLLLRHAKGDPDYSDLLQINQNANRAAALVEQLLAFSRKQTLQPKVVSVDEVLSGMTHFLNRLLGEKTTLVFSYAHNLPNVYVDKRQLEQVIMNLVVNARDAMSKGGQVDISTQSTTYPEVTTIQGARVPAGGYVQIDVVDSGTGIDPKNIKAIFDPFFTTKDVGEGTGLGLSTVYGIVKQTGGFIFVDSKVGKGTRFRLLLRTTNLKKPEVTEDKKNVVVSNSSLKGLCILLVEDELPVRSFAARALRMQHMEVLEAASAEEALSLIKDLDLKIDVVISDVVMPGEDGPSWVRKAKLDRPDLKVIFVSGYAEETFSKEFGEISDAKFLAKPFSLKALIQTVHDIHSA